MAKAKTITVELNLDNGAFSVDLNGFEGVGCAAITKMFEDLGEVKTSIKKPEFLQKTCNTVAK
jgi:hypothetical protein